MPSIALIAESAMSNDRRTGDTRFRAPTYKTLPAAPVPGKREVARLSLPDDPFRGADTQGGEKRACMRTSRCASLASAVKVTEQLYHITCTCSPGSSRWAVCPAPDVHNAIATLLGGGTAIY